jgi:hypothetical protein
MDHGYLWLLNKNKNILIKFALFSYNKCGHIFSNCEFCESFTQNNIRTYT